MSKQTDVYGEMTDLLGQVPAWVKGMPEATLGPFWTMMRDFQLAETVIPNKYKELIGLAVSGATRCKYCALFHTEAARAHGATDQEIAEASMMGAFTMLASTWLNAEQVDYDQFKRETQGIVKYVKERKRAGNGDRNTRPAHA
jgi:AhpD family alkylhydroperoxidase